MRLFFAYPSRPETMRETIVHAAEQINRPPETRVETWEQLRVGGKLVIDAILGAIDEAALSIIEVTDSNENVMFELGYSIGSATPVWLLRDTTVAPAMKKWDQVKILTTIGHVPYQSSQDVVSAFFRERPDTEQHSIFKESLEPNLFPGRTQSVLYVAGPYNTDAERLLSRAVQETVQQHDFRPLMDEPSEGLQPLQWYAQAIYDSVAVVAHFAAVRRTGSEVHNARCALVSGLARGMGKPVLMFAEEDYFPPIDFRDLLYVYKAAREAASRANLWLNELLPSVPIRTTTSERDAQLRLATELRSLRFGDHVAENEVDSLDRYFVETGDFLQVLEPKTSVFAGRKGTGKSANLLRAQAELNEDKRNLVLVIKPRAYELEGILRLLGHYDQRDSKLFLVETLWKFLLYSELAKAVAEQLLERPWTIGEDSPEWHLIRYYNDNVSLLGEEIDIRLERATRELLEVDPTESLVADRESMAAALHGQILGRLRKLLGDVLHRRERVAVLVDNLDKAWDKSADIDQLSHFLLGLLSGIGRISDDFARDRGDRRSVPLTLAVFLRSDILSHLLRIAREPDKIPVVRMRWENPDLLLRVVEERFIAAHEESDPEDLWKEFFEPTIGGESTRRYIARIVLPRPRDIVFFCNAAVTAAVNKRHTRILEEDVRDAELAYSLYAFDALLVENGITLAGIEDVLYEFAGARSILSEAEVKFALRRAGIASGEQDAVVDHLVDLAFLGIEVRDEEYEFPQEPAHRRRAEALARRRSDEGRTARYRIHPAFSPFLELDS